MKIKISVLIIALITSLTAFSQNFSFDYDDAGNRIERMVILLTKSELQDPRNVGEEIVEDEDSNKDEDLLEQFGNFELLVYPNPTVGEVVVKIIGDEIINTCSYKVYDLSGREILYGIADSYEMKINLENQVSGTYSLRVNLNGKEKAWIIVKE